MSKFNIGDRVRIKNGVLTDYIAIVSNDFEGSYSGCGVDIPDAPDRYFNEQVYYNDEELELELVV